MIKMSQTGKRNAIIILSITIVCLLLGNAYLLVESTNYRRSAGLELEVETGYCMHINVYVQRAGSDEIITIKDGVLLNNAGVLTTIGKDWIEDQMGDSPSTDPAKWISLSLDTGTPAAGWTEIPVEIVAGGLVRGAGTYTSTGAGVWTIHYEFTATATHTDVQLTGLQWAVSGDSNLLGADTFTPVTLNDQDKLTITWTITVS